jgi:hypothetical protein
LVVNSDKVGKFSARKTSVSSGLLDAVGHRGGFVFRRSAHRNSINAT